MKSLVAAFILVILLLTNISAQCNETQININTASVAELDNLTGIGAVYAQRIADARPFNSVDDLINVSGIGNKTLEKIKEQGLACVDDETGGNNSSENLQDNSLKNNSNAESENNLNESNQSANSQLKNISSASGNSVASYNSNSTKSINLTPISLTTQTIKSSENNSISTANLALLGVVTLGLMSGVLIWMKNRRRKNEFR